jgi:xylulose-5-phosphate/fructose-6-phosphate phosphoketolase
MFPAARRACSGCSGSSRFPAAFPVTPRRNHANVHVRGYKEEGTTTTPFAMTVLDDLDRFHLAIDAIDRVPRLQVVGSAVRQLLRDKLTEHKLYVRATGQDLPEVQHWRWGGHEPGQATQPSRKSGEPA